MTAVREYCNDDQHQLRDLAFRNYISVHSPASEMDPHAPGFQAYFQHLTGQHDQGGGHIFVAERDTQLIGLVCLLGPIPPSQAESSDESMYSCPIYSSMNNTVDRALAHSWLPTPKMRRTNSACPE